MKNLRSSFASAQLVFKLAAFLVLTGSVEAETWVVSLDGTADFATVSEGVAWAAEGDIVWVQPGNYIEAVIIDGKSVEVVASDGDEVFVQEVLIKNLLSMQRVALSGLSVSRTEGAATDLAALRIVNCRGSIRVQDCSFGGSLHRGAGISVKRSADAAFSNCLVSDLYYLGISLPAASLHVEDSNVSMFSCRVYGGSILHPAALIVNANLLVSDSLIIGRSGGLTPCPVVEDGGPGLIAQGTSCIYQLGGAIEGGEGGEAYGMFCLEYGSPGADVILGPSASLTELPGTPRNWTCSNVVTEGGDLHIEYEGEAGDRVFVERSNTGAHQFMQSRGGALLLVPQGLPAFLGVANSGGWLSVVLDPGGPQFPGPQKGFFLQVFAVSANGSMRLAGSNHVAIVSP